MANSRTGTSGTIGKIMPDLRLLLGCVVAIALFCSWPISAQVPSSPPNLPSTASPLDQKVIPGGVELPPPLPDTPIASPGTSNPQVAPAPPEVSKASIPPIQLPPVSESKPRAPAATSTKASELVPVAATQDPNPIEVPPLGPEPDDPQQLPPPLQQDAQSPKVPLLAPLPQTTPSTGTQPLGGIILGPIIDRPAPPTDASRTQNAGQSIVPPPPFPNPGQNVVPPPVPPNGILVPPAAEKNTTPGAEVSGTGTINLHVSDESIRKAFELLSSQGSMNILPSTGVSGNVTLNLRNVTFDQALDALTKIGNLSVKREGNLIYVYTAEEMADLEQKSKTQVVRVYCLNYMRAMDMATMLRPFLSRDGAISITPAGSTGIGSSTAAGMSGSGGAAAGLAGGSGGGGMGGGGASFGGGGAGSGTGMSGGGVTSGGTSAAGSSVSTGGATGGNSLAGGDSIIVRDYADRIAQIDEIVAKLDIQPMQVLIEAVILSVQLDDSQQLGMNFSLVDKLQNVAAVGGNGNLINAAAGFSPAKVLTTAAAVAPSLLPRPGQLVNGYLANDQGLKFGFISRDVSGFIRAIETMNKVNILASPRVLVLNKQKAEIQLGQRLGYRNTVTNLTSSLETVQFLSVGTLLSLRPYVSQDGMVRMEIHPEKSTGALDGNGIPQTVTSELTTNILVPDGATIVIGGLIDSTDQGSQQGVLGLSRLPLVGPLFRERIGKATKTELIVLLTPRILNRHGLPEPQPGLPPVGPSGIPNSGPMPGPRVFANSEGGPALPGAGEGPASVPGDLAPASDVQIPAAELSPLASGRLGNYEWIGKPDAMVRPTSGSVVQGSEPVTAPVNPALAVSPTEAAKPAETTPVDPAEREIPISVSAAPVEKDRSVVRAKSTQSEHPKGKKESLWKSYRPGSLTRGLIESLKARPSAKKTEETASPRTAPSASPSAEPFPGKRVVQNPPPKPSPWLPERKPGVAVPESGERLVSYSVPASSSPSVGPTEPGRRESTPTDASRTQNSGSRPHSSAHSVHSIGVTYRWHTVQQGEDFGTLAKEHYGSSSLRGALWQVNRHLVAAPDQLNPGTMILIPPADIIDRVVQEGTVRNVTAQEGNGTADREHSSSNSGRFRLFGRP